MPLVSVIIPNYNHATYLEQRIESVLNQTFQDFEVILLDDKSTDDSVEVLRKYENHSKVSHLVVNKENSGKQFMLKQWQLGLSLAKGKYIWIAESDDWAEDSFLEKLLPCFDKGDNIGLVHCDSKAIENGKFTFEYKKLMCDMFKDDVWNEDINGTGIDFLKKYYWRWMTVHNMSASLFNKEKLSSVLGVLREFNGAIDYEICMYMFSRYNFYYIKEPLNNYRLLVESYTKKNSISSDKDIKVKRFVTKFIVYTSLIRKEKDFKVYYKKSLGKLFYSFYTSKFAFKDIVIGSWDFPIIICRFYLDKIYRIIKNREVK